MEPLVRVPSPSRAIMTEVGVEPDAGKAAHANWDERILVLRRSNSHSTAARPR